MVDPPGGYVVGRPEAAVRPASISASEPDPPNGRRVADHLTACLTRRLERLGPEPGLVCVGMRFSVGMERQ